MSNIAGLQMDLMIRVFAVRFLAGLFFLLAVYGIFLLKNYCRESSHKNHHQQDIRRLQKQLLLQKLQQADDQELCTLFVAYLEKFSTKTGTHSLESLLMGAGCSPAECTHITQVYYGKGKLYEEMKEKMIKIIKK